MNKLIRIAVLVALATLPLSSVALAGTATSTFTVTANVTKNCTISAANIAFGPYDPIVANAVTPLTLPSTVTVACTKGAVATVGLNAGTNPGAGGCATTRAMSSGGGAPSYLCYEIYQPAPGAGNVSATTTVWGNVAASWWTYTSAGKAPFGLVDTGQIPAGQDVPALSYTDSVIATVTF